MRPLTLRQLGKVLGTIFLICFVPAACAILMEWMSQPQQRATWWLEHSYPLPTEHVHQRHLRFATYPQWRQAGRDIPGIGAILVGEYHRAESEQEQVRLLFAMGAVPDSKTVDCLSDVAVSTRRAALRDAALAYGLMPNIELPSVRQALMRFVMSTQGPVEDRCWILAELLYAGSDDAIAYASTAGQDLLFKAELTGASLGARQSLAQQMHLAAASRFAPAEKSP